MQNMYNNMFSTMQNRSTELERALLEANQAIAELRAQNTRRASALPSSLKLATPPSYCGKDKESVETWLFQLEEMFDLHQITDDRQRITTAGNLLRDPAATWYRAARTGLTFEHLDTWDDFKRGLRGNFNGGDTVKKARDKLAELRMHDSLRDYTREFRLTTMEIPRMAEDEKLDRFVRGLRTRLRLDVEKELAREPENRRTFDTAVRLAETCDLLDRRVRNRDDGGRRPMDLNAARYDKGDRRQGTGGSKGPLTPEEKRRRFKEGLCLYCGTSGHQAKDCPSKPAGNGARGGKKPPRK